MKKLYVVVPCYNEEETLVDSTYKLTQKLNSLISDKKITEDSRIYYIDDGSKDSTWALIEKLHNENSFVNGIKLSKNRGHQNALLAGLMSVKNECDCCITIDADLQDDINSFDEMIEKFEQGYEIVYGVRNDRKSDTAFKRGTAQLYYKILSFFGAEIVYNHADYRLFPSSMLILNRPVERASPRAESSHITETLVINSAGISVSGFIMWQYCLLSTV